jgi:hypothetical protein
MTKMTDAFKKIFLGLGGDPKELAENNDVGDYILDLEGAIKKTASDAVGEVINDSEVSDTTTYSSNKIESLIPSGEYEVVTLSVPYGSSTLDFTFPESTTREQFVTDVAAKRPTVVKLVTVMIAGDGGFPLTFMNTSLNMMSQLNTEQAVGADVRNVIYHGIATDMNKKENYEVYVKIGNDPSNDAIYYKAFEFPTT